ncbi:MAG: hypothetical protein HYV07_34055 [Deltaproteobacteria bacterium]|nr:hypothetical protein [Deltaproteobacteria bacterium]
MYDLSVNELTYAMKDLVEKRLDVLQSSSVGRLYKPLLIEKYESLAAATARPSKAAVAAELSEAGAEHDLYGAAIANVIDTYLRIPTLGSGTRQVLERARANLIPTRAELKAPYAEEAAKAASRRAKLAELEADLASIGVVEGQTLLDWAEKFIAAGELLGKLLSARADEQASRARPVSPQFRSEIVGLLGRMRTALRDEIEIDPSHPRNLESQIFGAFDEIARLRGMRGRKSVAPAAPEPTPV